jgi:hypothetical protein
MLGHQFHQHFVLALDLLLQKIDPLLLLLDLTAGERSFVWKAEAAFSNNSFCQR